MSSFREQAGNWQIVGDVIMDRTLDIHHEEAPEPTGKKKKKKKKNEPETPTRKAVTFTAGTGILLNMNDDVIRDNLVSNWEHGDIELELDVMIPKGSNSGIYLQGRYEVQLLDSWGVKQPRYGDLGGIYRNWETEPSLMLKGVPPTSNPAKAPGLWQHMKIRFRAPRFDDAGNKTANARFEFVEINGVRVHNNVEVVLPTGGPISKDEAARGPLMIQGDHGPVAFKNIQYTSLEESMVTLSDLKYAVYKGAFKNLGELNELTPESEGEATQIDILTVDEEDAYGIIYAGKINIPEDADYTFRTGFTGGMRLMVNGSAVLEVNSNAARSAPSKTVALKKGSYDFELTNIKSAPWHAPRLGLFVNAPTTDVKKFHHYDSYPLSEDFVSPILINPKAKPRILRAFIWHDSGEKLTHTVGVGHPNQVNFVYDHSRANWVAAWRGNFVDATPMWHNRGNGSFRPQGSVLWNNLSLSFAELADANTPFPTPEEKDEFQERGYQIDAGTGLPIFRHTYKGVEVQDMLTPDAEGRYLSRKVTFSQGGLANWYLKLAEGDVLTMPDGSYAIGDRSFYINVLSGGNAMVREVDGKQELVLPVTGTEVNYEIIW